MSPGKRFPRGSRGFTLLEVLVVLVLVSLTMTVLMQGVLYTLQLRTQFLTQQQRLREDFLPESWFRSSSAALAPVKADRPEAFQGDREGFRGLSLMPLLGKPGEPVRIEWRLTSSDGQRILQYRQENREEVVAVSAWPETTQVGLDYLDGNGHWSERWPPPTAPAPGSQPPPQLPAALRLKISDQERRSLWLVPIAGRRDPPIDPFDELPVQP